MKLNRQPVKARPMVRAKSSWFYEHAKSIDVYVETFKDGAVACRIRRIDIEDWIKRTKA